MVETRSPSTVEDAPVIIGPQFEQAIRKIVQDELARVEQTRPLGTLVVGTATGASTGTIRTAGNPAE